MSLLQIDNLEVHFPASGGVARVVDGVSFEVERGEVFGLVGASGSGKTMTALAILRLVAPPGRIVNSSVVFDNRDLMEISDEEMRAVRGSRIAIVFQEPATAFNPVLTVGYQLVEAILAHQKILRGEANDRVLDALKRVHIPDPRIVFASYPHQLSGGTKQRAMIAMALLNGPDLLMLDEPTTALDVTVQAQILDLLAEVIAEAKMTAIFISHDFGVIGRMCHRVAVMCRGKIVEIAPTAEIMQNPQGRYTRELLASARLLASV